MQNFIFKSEKAPPNTEHKLWGIMTIHEPGENREETCLRATQVFSVTRKITVKDLELDQRIPGYLPWKTMHFSEHTTPFWLI